MKGKMKKRSKKKGITRHHLRYGEDEIVVEIPSRGSHLILTSFQSMKPTMENIRLIRNYKKAVAYILKEKEIAYENEHRRQTEGEGDGFGDIKRG